MSHLAAKLPLRTGLLFALLLTCAVPALGGDEDSRARVIAISRFLLEGEQLEDDGLPGEATERYEKAARLAREAKAPDDEIEALMGRFRCQLAEYDYKGMLETLEQLIRVHTEQGSFAKAARSESDLGGTLVELGSLEEGLSHLQRALDALPKEDERARAFTLTTMAIALARQRHYASALDRAHEAEQIFRNLEEDAERGYALSVIASIHLDIGAYERAELLLEKLVAQEPEGSANRAEALHNLGFAQYRMDRLDAAASSLDAALATFKKRKATRRAASALVHRGEVEERRGNAEGALEMYRAAKQLDPNNPHVKIKIGDALLQLPKPAIMQAKEVYHTALDEADRLDDILLRTDALRGLAQVALALNGSRTSLGLAEMALTSLEVLDNGLADEQSAFARAHYPKVLRVALRSAVAVGEPAGISAVLERTRAQSLTVALGSTGTLDVPEEVRRRELEVREAVVKAQMLYLDARDEGVLKTIGERRAQLNEAQRTYRNLLESIERAGKRTGTRRLAHVSLDDLKQLLDKRAAFVQYVLRDGIAGALVVTQTKARWIDLGDAAKIERTCENLRNHMAEGVGANAFLSSAKRQLVTPLELPANVTTLYVSPDDGIASIPFAELLPERVKTAYVQSGTVLSLLLPARELHGEHLIALADPEYSVERKGHAIRVYGGGAGLAALPRTRETALAVKREGDRVLIGKHATEAGLRLAVEETGRVRVIQFGCHGILNSVFPNLSSLALTPSHQDDGFLTAVETLRLELNTDLVVLSACGTGRGRAVQGEGLMSLARSFMAAGAPRVIASLWPVDDAATSALMIKLHEGLRDDSLSTAAALRRAQAHVRSQKRWKHTKYWAAWVIWGLPE